MKLDDHLARRAVTRVKAERVARVDAVKASIGATVVRTTAATAAPWARRLWVWLLAPLLRSLLRVLRGVGGLLEWTFLGRRLGRQDPAQGRGRRPAATSVKQVKTRAQVSLIGFAARVAVVFVTAGFLLLLVRGYLVTDTAKVTAAAVAVVALVVAGHRRRPPEPVAPQWWDEPALRWLAEQVGLTRRGDPAAPSFRRIGPPVRDERGEAVTVQLPNASPWTVLAGKHEQIAAAWEWPLHLVRLSHNDDDPHNRVTIWRGYPQPRRATAPTATVATAGRTDWTRPVRIGEDVTGRAVMFATTETHSLLVGGTGSGKSWTGRVAVAHAVLDPTVRLWLIDGKGAGDWAAMVPLCQGAVQGAGEGDVDRAESVLSEVKAYAAEQQSRPVGQRVRSVLVVDEWYVVRANASMFDKKQAERLDALMGSLLATTRSGGVHIILHVQRGTADYVTKNQAANLLQRLVGKTSQTAEVQYVLDTVPAALPSRAGEFLVQHDGSTPTLVTVDRLDDAGWRGVCQRAVVLRGASTVADPAGERVASSMPGTLTTGAGTTGTLTAAHVDTTATADPGSEPVAEPVDLLLAAVVDILRDQDPAGLPAGQLLALLPDGVRPPSAAALGKALALWPGHVAKGFRGSARVWRLTPEAAGSAVGGTVGDPSVVRR